MHWLILFSLGRTLTDTISIASEQTPESTSTRGAALLCLRKLLYFMVSFHVAILKQDNVSVQHARAYHKHSNYAGPSDTSDTSTRYTRLRKKHY